MNALRKLAVVVVVLLSPVVAQADPTLIGEIEGDRIGGAGSNSFLEFEPIGVVFVLGYPTAGTRECPGYIGCEKTWSFGETGTLDFTSSNTSNFAAVTANLMDATDDTLCIGALTVNSNSSILFPAASYCLPEDFTVLGASVALWDFLGPDILTIDFIRLVVSATNITDETTNGWQQIDYEYRATWQLYGTTAKVPEPSTLALLGIGLLGMALARRRKKA